jgi:hypothetical protein
VPQVEPGATLRSKLSWARVSETSSLSATSTNGLLVQFGDDAGVTWMAPSESPAIAPAIPRWADRKLW